MIQRIFLGRDEPAVTAAARLLSLQKPIDLSHSLVIVPTRASSIKLTHELVRLSPRQAIILPEITTADKLIRSFIPDSPKIASPHETLTAWAKVLMNIKPSHYSALFGKLTLTQNFSWACSCGEQLQKTQNILAESGYSFTSIAEIFSHSETVKQYDLDALLPPGEAARWRDLAALETLVFEKLHSWNRVDHNQAILDFLSRPFPQSKHEQVILLCHPDPLPFIFPLLNSWSEQGTQVTTWIHADEALADGFDPYGRPIISYWENNLIPLPEGNECLHISPEPATLANEVIQHIASKGMNSNEIALGVCDASFTPHLELALNNAGWKPFNAAGYKASGTVWQRLFNVLRDSFSEPDALSSISEIISSPLIQEILKLDNPYNLLLELDKIREEHLPETLAYAETLLPSPAKEDFVLLKTWLASWRNEPFCTRMQSFIQEIRENDLLSEYLTPDFELLAESVRAIAPLEEEGILTDIQEVLLLTEQCFLKQNAYDDPIPTDLSLDNWLELPFTPEPHLILVAFHEGNVPESNVADPFLPEKLRVKLNLRGTAQRMARDAFLLDSMLNSRRANGSAHLFLSKQDSKGNPCLPSSLLMRCSEDELPQRVKALFPEETPPIHRPAATRGDWFLSSPPIENPWASPSKAFSPSILKEFLNCPLRFWLKKIRGFERMRLESAAQANQLGNIIHATMEEFNQQSISATTDIHKIRQFLLNEFDNAFYKQFGSALSLPLTLQHSFGQRRMEAVAEAHIRLIEEGWRPFKTEEIVNKWELAPGYFLNMRIDCLMRNSRNDILLIDYKTGTITPPKDAHLKSISQKKEILMVEYLPDIPLLTSAGDSKTYRWKDLQLPLYKLWAQSQFKDGDIKVSYFNIPLDQDRVGLSSWDDLDENTLTSAKDCALAIMKLIRQGEFEKLPSAERLGWDLYPNDSFLYLGNDGLEKAFNLPNFFNPNEQ